MSFEIRGKAQRIGVFELSQTFVWNWQEEVKQLFASMVVLRAEAMAHSYEIQYICICQEFDTAQDCASGQSLPKYDVRWDGDDKIWTVRRLGPKGEERNVRRITSNAAKVQIEK